MLQKMSAVLLVIIIAGCSQQKIDTKAEGEKIMQLSRDWSKQAAQKDVDKIVNYWSDDATLYSSGMPEVKGKPALKQMVQQMMNVPGFKISWEPLRAEVSESGDMAYLIEQNEVSMNDSTGKTIVERANVVTIWKKNAAGEWKAVVDIASDKAP